MWYKQVLAQFGGGVDFSGEEKVNSQNASQNNIGDVGNKLVGLYDELSGVLQKMGKTLDEYYSMNQMQQKEIRDLLIHENPEETTLEEQLRGLQQENNNSDPQSMASREKGNSFQHFKNGEGYYQASTGKQDPILFGNMPSSQTWY
jgi:hypothetical protein